MKCGALVLSLLTGLLLAPTAASAETAEPSATLRGTCTIIGETQFEPGITLQPRQVTLTAHPQGHCTGTLTTANGEQRGLMKEPMTMNVVGAGTHSCLGGSSEGAGHIAVAGEQIDFTWRLTQLTAETLAWIRGADGGSAFGPITPDLAPSNFALMVGCIQPTAQSVLSGRLDLVTSPALAG
jgi:hypothetical protein